MPELPDIEVYVAALERRIGGEVLEGIRLGSPFVLRSVAPRPEELRGRRVVGVRRLGKRIVIDLEHGAHVVIHLMVAGRLAWRTEPGGPALKAMNRLAAFDFSSGSLLLTEAGTKKRASVHLVDGPTVEHDRRGLEVLEATLEQFDERLRSENHTLKRALTDPRLFSGIGNAYSDEILHRAALSPMRWTSRLSHDQVETLYRAIRDVLHEWTQRLLGEVGSGFPRKVTAFRPEMAVHGKYRQPCPVCGAPVQRIVYAENECNYCARCQTGGKLLKDRALSQLLKGDWPKTLQELEERRS